MAKYTPTELEERWARNWVLGVAKVLARGPPGEPKELTKKQIEEIEKIALAPGSEVYEKAKTWYRKMQEIFAPVA